MDRIAELPADLNCNPKIKRLLDTRRKKVHEGKGIDWGTAEWLAYGSLLLDGSRVRLTGQDARRGTFSHRHAVIYDAQNGSRYVPLRHLGANQASFEIYDSPLSEAGVLGFEYGYALDTPDALVLWEAQFGDFVNGAQVIIDQFISSSEDKWHRLSGVVLLLPHGFEGQGPEHSSARLERFLALCAEDNIQVCNLTTPAQYFHCLRRQVVRPWRKPLVIMTPKSLLRHPLATSTLEDLSQGTFQAIIGEQELAPRGNVDAKKVRRVILCAGKLYYDLVEARRKKNKTDVAILRLEQLYPLRKDEISKALAPYGKAEIIWAQEEPWNMGSWFFIQAHLGETLGEKSSKALRCVSRPASASPATGSGAAHKLEQQALLDEALG